MRTLEQSCAPAQAQPLEIQVPTESARGELLPNDENGAGGDCSLNRISASQDSIYALLLKMERPDTSRRQLRQLTEPFTIAQSTLGELEPGFHVDDGRAGKQIHRIRV